MKKDDIIRMAREADLCDEEGRDTDSIVIVDHLELFAALVAAAEREECAKLCIEIEPSPPLSNRVGWEHGTVDCAKAIRARSKT